MNAEEKWLRDLVEGEKGEKLFTMWMIERGWKFIEKGRDNKWDLILEKKKRFTFELKTDRWEKFNRETGNMFIEVYCNNKPSGISVTQSDIFVYFFPEREELWFIKTSDLRELIRERGDLFWRNSRSGDGGKVTGLLCKRDQIKEVGFKVYKIKKSSLWKE
jgi:hypothetical protein